MGSTLFREEAIAHQQQQRMGDALHINTSYFIGATLAFAVLLGLLITYLIVGQYTRKAHVSGFLAPSQGMVKVFTPQAGTVVEKHVSEGQKIAQGEILFVLSSEQASLDSVDAQTKAIIQIVARRDSLLEELEQQDELNQIQIQQKRAYRKSLQQESVQLAHEIELLQQRLHGTELTLAKFHQLFAKHFVAELQLREKQDAVLAQQGILQTLKRKRLTLNSNLTTLSAEIASSRYQFAQQRAELDRRISSLEQDITEHQARKSIVITAPIAGTATAILLEPGQQAGSQTPLLSILPRDSELLAYLLVPSRAIGFIAPGQAVALRYQAFPYQRFGSQSGRVAEISKTLIAASEADFPIKLTEPAYRIKVKPDQQTLLAYQQDIPLQAGMLLDADIALDQRALYQWIFDPLYSLAGKL